MRRFYLILFYFFIKYGDCLWTKGVVHYAINNKDYDLHSRDIIMTTLDKIQNEICVKFFHTPLNYSASEEDKILYISNPDKRKNCPTETYEYDGSVVDMHIGYRCLNELEIARMVVEMLRASIKPQGMKPNSYDLLRQFQLKEQRQSSNILPQSERNLINAAYLQECAKLHQKPMINLRRFSGGNIELSVENEKFFRDKLWPFGIVMYGVEQDLDLTQDFKALQVAMTSIELASCIVFQRIVFDDVLVPKNFLWFTYTEGEIMPRLGFTPGNQTLILHSMVHGAPGHEAHALNILLRIIGLPMMSNRYDRDNYVTINWKNVQKGMEHYLERMPIEAILKNLDGEAISYDYSSATHAPANYLCKDCSLGQQTVTPLQDHLWMKTQTMGHRNSLNPSDREIVKLLYNKQCQSRMN